MHRRDQGRRREELDGRRADDHPLRRSEADKVLALQRSAGNQAVSGLLARSPDTAEPKTEGAEGTRATLSGIGTIPLLSASFGMGNAPGGSTSGRREGGKGPREIVLVSKVGEHSAKLVKATADGNPMAVEVILASGVRLKLKGALVSRYSTSGEGPDALESWTLDFESLEQSREGGESGE
jgi:hypothetical protein